MGCDEFLAVHGQAGDGAVGEIAERRPLRSDGPPRGAPEQWRRVHGGGDSSELRLPAYPDCRLVAAHECRPRWGLQEDGFLQSQGMGMAFLSILCTYI